MSRARVVFPDPVLPMIRIRLHPSRLLEGSRRVEVIGSIITARAIECRIVPVPEETSGRYSNRRELCRRLRAEVAVHAEEVAELHEWLCYVGMHR
jgi:hypothetical protein